jgi:hypothetical protein
MKSLLVIITFSALVLSSCSHYYYVANIQNVPMFKEKDELRLSGAYGFGDESNCFEAQAAYSITNKIGVMANLMSARGGDESARNYGKGTYLEGAVGYYKPEGKHGVFEIYGGVGGCSQHHEYLTYEYSSGTTYSGYSDLSFMKVFVQPSFGLTFNWLDVALSGRICSLIYTSIDNKVSGSHNDFEKINALQGKVPFNFEPAFTLRTGWENVKIEAQAEYAGMINQSGLNIAEEWHLSIGLNIAFAKRSK